MSKISIVMPVYNAEKTVAEAIESVLKQTHEDFELIIIDDGSEDDTLSKIRSCTDSRIVLLESSHDFVGSLNKGLHQATGKYIARMDADDVMHIDRLKIQHAIMEEEPMITICGTWMILFGENVPRDRISGGGNGLIEYPVLQLLRGNFLNHPTTLIKRDFLVDRGLQYEHYAYAEDYKLWFEIAKQQGVFYIESQPLLYYRISETQVSRSKQKEQAETSRRIKQEVLEYLIEQNKNNYSELTDLYHNLCALKVKNLFTEDDVFAFFYAFFAKNKINLISGHFLNNCR